MHLCNAELIDLRDTIVNNFKNDVLIKRWNENGDIIFDNFLCEDFIGECCIVVDEPFLCVAI